MNKEWEKEFVERFDDYFQIISDEVVGETKKTVADEFLSFISSLLSAQKKEIVEMVEKTPQWARGFKAGYDESNNEVIELCEMMINKLSNHDPYFKQFTALDAYELALKEIINKLKEI